MFVDETSLPGYRIQSLFEPEKGNPLVRDVITLMDAYYGVRNPFFLATCDSPQTVARKKLEDTLSQWESDRFLRQVSLVVIDCASKEVVSVLLVKTLKSLVDVTSRLEALSQKCINSTRIEDGDIHTLLEYKLLAQVANAKHMHDFHLAAEAGLVMEGARMLNVPNKTPKGVSVVLGRIQCELGNKLGAKYTYSLVNDLSHSASTAVNSLKFGPILFKDVPELVKYADTFSLERKRAVFDPVPQPNKSVSSTGFAGESLQVYNVEAMFPKL